LANVIFNSGKVRILGGQTSPNTWAAVNLRTGVTNLTLHSLTIGSFSPTTAGTPANGTTWSDVSSTEISGTGYTAGGIELASKQISVDSSNNRGYFTSNAATWTTATLSANAAVLTVKASSGSPPASTDPVIGIYDFGGTKSSSAGNFTVQGDATDGWLYI
jgi:hypothetical protein